MVQYTVLPMQIVNQFTVPSSTQPTYQEPRLRRAKESEVVNLCVILEEKFTSSELIKLSKLRVADRQEQILLSAHNWWKENYLLIIVQILKRIILLIRRQNKGYHQWVISLLLRPSLNTLANWRLPSHKWRDWSESTTCTHKTGEPINDLRLYIHLKAPQSGDI